MRFAADEVPDALAADLLPAAQVLATPLREVPSAGVNDWTPAAWFAGTGYVAGPVMPACMSWTASAPATASPPD